MAGAHAAAKASTWSGFSFPVVPRGQARIRTQMSAAHEPDHIDRAVAAFAKVGRELGDQVNRHENARQDASASRASGWPRAAMPEVGHNDVLIKVAQDRHLRHRHAHLQLGRVVAEDHPGADDRGPRVRGRRSRPSGEEVRGLKIGQRVSGEGHLVCGHCRNCRAGRRHLCRNTQGVGVNRPGAFAEYLVIPAENAFPDSRTTSPTTSPSILDPFGNAARTRRSPSIWWARTCSSPAPGPSASWPPRSAATSARATSSSPT